MMFDQVMSRHHALTFAQTVAPVFAALTQPKLPARASATSWQGNHLPNSPGSARRYHDQRTDIRASEAICS